MSEEVIVAVRSLKQVMLKDSQELKVSTNSAAAVNAINSFVEQLLSMGNNAQVILQAVEAEPSCAIANAHAAAFYLFSGTSDTFAQAQPYLNAAKANLIYANEREQLYIAAIEAWAKRDIKQAIAYHEAIAAAFKRDLASVSMPYSAPESISWHSNSSLSRQ